nr:MAG TPA: lysozyme [Caudoviricetes sp.]
MIKSLKSKFPGITVCGHRDYSSKACPSFDAKTEYKNI